MSSKYDVIKVKVHLSDVHYYVLSRFLLSKMLMFCRVPEDTAVRISLDVKKHFVNTERTSITQAELENYIRCSMIAAGFAQEHAQLFSVVTQFHAERIPLVLFLAGPERCGKTTLAHLLAARINCSTVINAEVLRDISASIDDSLPLFAVPETSSPDSTPSMLRGAEVSAVVAAEVDKAVREGRAIIVEGENLSFAGFHRFLEPSFQLSTGAVILGLVMEICGGEAETDASHAYVQALPNLHPVYSTERLTVLAADIGDLAKGVRGIPTVYVARYTTVADNVCLSVFLHDIVVKRIIAELKRRGRVL
ncbi:conserved hypothetical protein [Leishmania major strain Friedlin]|uniref:Zeta toxin domain-containing protein n=1 Tax=Leishmania major TaxID=5664 RepID=E9AFY9_LEIMA|nr:conserved hypothetical protein [Leishmania major strain Friedlin]CAG9582872.1 hypothetical_protein_-_conserved [Leishmania major strain Friedlin]CBZ13144.1 conserved hypothetical protein [Leishmania major strain Friedlin]|eukprot:XP_003722909.1 conserved hypothetical protein [Leishmania major strain Friedlin]